jgi:hypothetical protein
MKRKWIQKCEVDNQYPPIPTNYVSKLKAKYRAAGAQPSNTQYGWIKNKI